MSAYSESVLSLLRAERASRSPAADARGPFDPRVECHAGQLEAVSDRSAAQAWVTSRRAGKSRGAVYRGLMSASETPDVNVLYLSTSIKRAVNTLWDLVLRTNRDAGLGGVPNHTRHCLRLPNGSQFWVSGCETKTEADAWRGVLPRTALVMVDEGQDWKSDLLSYLYADVIAPSLADIGGAFILMGTPGAPRGFFYDFSRRPGTPSHHWTIWGNPHIKDARGLMAEAMRVRGCDDADPSIRREFYGEFVTDLRRQIFPVGPQNWYTARPGGKWRHVVAFDAGTVDHAAVVVVGWTDATPNLYVIETHSIPGLGSTAQIELVRSVCARYPGASVVADPGGGGKSHVVTLRQEHWLAVEGAEKTDKAAACITLRDGLRSGRVLIPEAEKAFADELGQPEWDPEAVGSVIAGHFPDRVDAMLYAYRKAAALHHWKPTAPTKTPEERQAERDMAAQADEERVMRDLGL